MELTTQQIYALFAIATAVAMLIGITYCAGMRTGRKSADYLTGKLEKINAATSKTLAKRTADLIESNRLLDSREAALSKLRQSLREEQADHDSVNRALIKELKRITANGLTMEHWLTLKLAAKQLGLAAYQFTKSGSSKTNQAALAQARLNEVAERLHAALTAAPLLGEMATDAVDLITDTPTAGNAISQFMDTRAERAA